jgi:prepilin-type N-terminal cleavage/methylation domain-containing protein
MRRRQAFTLVEMLVSLALIVFIMTILAEAFSSGIETFRRLKAVGDLQDKLRNASSILRRDLAADHFEGKKRLSDPDFWDNGPPKQGFFRLWESSVPLPTPWGPPSVPGLTPAQLAALTPIPHNFPGPLGGPPNPPYPPFPAGANQLTAYTAGCVRDGFDPSVGAAATTGRTSSLHSYRTHDHAIHMTVHYTGGNSRGDYMLAGVPAGSPLLASSLTTAGVDSRYQDIAGALYSYSWAEVVYFLRPSLDPLGNIETTNGPNSPRRYTLHRAQRLCVPDNSTVTQNNGNVRLTYADASRYAEMSATRDPNPASPAFLYLNSPRDLTMPARRLNVNNPTAPALPQSQDPVYSGILPGLTPQGYLVTAPNVTDFAPPYPTLKQLGAIQTVQGSDVLLTDVLSFDVRILLYGGGDFVSLYEPSVQAFAPNDFTAADTTVNRANPAYVGNGLRDELSNPRVFDTWTDQKDDVYDYSTPIQGSTPLPGRPPTVPPQPLPTKLTPRWQGPMYYYDYVPNQQPTLRPNYAAIPLWKDVNNNTIRIMALRITIRIWDERTKQTKQITIVQDM